MKKTPFTSCMAFLLVVALTFGQGAPVMAMSVMNADQTPMSASMNMAGMDMSVSDQASKDCCAHSGKDKAMKGAMCDACCAAAAQSALLPPQFPVPVQYAVAYSYELTDSTAVSKSLPPEPPPPKA